MSADAPNHPRVTDAVKQQFIREGYCVLPQVVPKPLVDAALRAINAEIGKGIMTPVEADDFVDGACFKDLQHQPVIRNLIVQSEAAPILRAFIGEYHPVWGGQIALRFPGIGCADKVTFTPNPWWNRGWHIDGLSTKKHPHPGTIHNFTALVGVILQDIPDQMSGNLGVFPGGHMMMQDHVRETGFEKLLLHEQPGLERLPQKIPLPPVHQVLGKAGDMVVCHYMLPHTILPNVSPNIRYAVYFRLHSINHSPGQFRPEAMLNAWVDWKGLHRLLNRTDTQVPAGMWSCKFCTLDNLANANLCAACDNPRSQQHLNPQKHQSAQIDYHQPLQSDPSNATRAVTFTYSNPQIDREVVALNEAGEKAFNEHDWVACQTIYSRLSTLRPEDPVYSLRAGEAHTWTSAHQLWPIGETYLRRTIQLLPMPAAYKALAENLDKQKKYAEIPSLAKVVTSMPLNEEEGMRKWQKDCVYTTTELAVKALFSMGKSKKECNSFLSELQALSPDPEVESRVSSQMEILQLTKEAEEAVHTEPKNFLKGQKLYARLCELKPKDYWVHFMAAICHTYSVKNNPALAEEYLRKGFEISPIEPLGHALMCRVLVNKREYRKAIEEMNMLFDMVTPEKGYDLGEAHQDLFIDMMRSMKEAHESLYGPESSAYEQCVERFKRTFPPLRFKVDALKYEKSCTVM